MPKVYNKRDPNVPKGAVYVGRPTKWGNPYSIGASYGGKRRLTREDVISLFRRYVYSDLNIPMRAHARTELRGKDLVCWCAPLPCHADIWLEIANAD